MAARASVGNKRDSCRFSSVLSSAVCEWLLILLLFLDAFFSYLVTQFARHCKLRTPCLLCSRLDHILGNEKPGFYKNLICNAHKLEISSWACSNVHQKLADVHENPKTYRSLVGKAGDDLDNSENAHLTLPVADSDCEQSRFYGEDAAQVPLLKKDLSPSTTHTRHRSCSSETFGDQSHTIPVLQSKASVAEVHELGSFISNSTGRSLLSHQVHESEEQEKLLAATIIHHSRNQGFDHLYHIGYSELKVTSDSESEVPFSDDDDGTAAVQETENLKKDVAVFVQPEPLVIMPGSVRTILSDAIASEKLVHPTPVLDETSKIMEKVHNVGESPDTSSLVSTAAMGHGLEELNWGQVAVKTNSPVLSERVSSEVPVDVQSAKGGFLAQCESISSEVPVEVQNAKDALGTSDNACFPRASSGDVSKELGSTGTHLKLSKMLNEPGSAILVSLDLNDAYKLAVGSKSNLTSPTLTEVVNGKDSCRVHEDLRLLLSQISASRGLEFPWNDMTPSPRVPGQVDELKFSDASSSIVLQNISKRLSIERNESGLESLDGSIISEIEGESPLDRLKRQLELDRKSMSLLYKELEEERNASAIAANQAMAMITRLQEEKAAMQMEALQYQRMMEEQAEYDQEALQKLNELLTQREKETQDLEEEIDNYRMRFGDEQSANKQLGSFDDREAVEDCIPKASNSTSRCEIKSDQDKVVSQGSRLKVSSVSRDLLFDFEDEKYISDCLKKLEKKLHLYSNNGLHVDVPGFHEKEDGCADKVHEVNGLRDEQANDPAEKRTGVGHYSSEESKDNGLENHHLMDVCQENCQMGGKVFLEESCPCPYSENSVLKASSVLTSHNPQFMNKENHEGSLFRSLSGHDRRYSESNKESKFADLLYEISQLNERLEGLEADRNFLEHSINSLRYGNDGVQFIQEIACSLRDLRQIGITLGEH